MSKTFRWLDLTSLSQPRGTKPKCLRIAFFLMNRFLVLVFIIGSLLGCDYYKESGASGKKILHVAITDLHHDYTWDIHKVRGLYTHLISYMIAEPPIRINSDGTYLPSVFKSWVFSRDKKTLTVEISDEFKFHDGSRIEVRHVLNSLLKALDSKSKQGGHNDLLSSLCDGSKCNIKKLSNNKIQFQFKRYTNAIIPSFTLSELAIFPDSYFTKEDKKKVINNLSGPFQVISFEPKLMKLRVNRSHPLVRDNCPDYVYLHQLKNADNIATFFKKHSDVVVFSAHANRAAKMKLAGAKVKVFPPLVAELVQLNRYSKKFKTKADRKIIASKLYHTFKSVLTTKKFTTVAKQYFPPYSVAYIKKGVEELYVSDFGESKDKLRIATYDELGFGPFFDKFKKKGLENNLQIELDTFAKKKFFNFKNTKGLPSEQPDAFYYFSGVGTPNPIFELTYMIERTNAGRYATPEIEKLLEKARYEIDEIVYKKTLQKIHLLFLSEYLIVPLRYSSPVFHFKGGFAPADDVYTGELDFWNWTQN